MKHLLVFLLTSLIICSCKKDTETVLVIKEQYAPSHWTVAGLIKGNLYSGGFDKPLYSDLLTNNDRIIRVTGLISGTYRFEYYVKPTGDSYWPVPRDTVFQIRDGETKEIIIK